MISALDRHGISLQLTPMQLPEAVPQPGSVLAGFNELATAAVQENPCLVLHPGEPARMILQVRNWEVHSLQLLFWVEGNFPADWCQLVPETAKQVINTINRSGAWQAIDLEEIEISAKGKWSGELLFLIPSNFFEDWQAIKSGSKKRLNLNLRGSLSVYQRHSHNQQPVLEYMQQVNFDLYVRPHSNYVNLLPLLYREVDFINRLISIFEQAFEPVVNSYRSMWANLDPLTSPQALLPFLSYWVAWHVEPHWNLKQQRRLIRHAMELYRWRGTRRGLRLYLHLYTGLPLDDDVPQEANKHISITEPFGAGMVLGNSRIGEDAVLGGGNPYHFVVRLRSDRDRAIDEQLVRRILDSEKPAFCTYELIIENLYDTSLSRSTN
ncbi:hypothetical protein B7486_38965 [cyanobacterium TDX16]|nr:hypothetical protein B7486_38965 [cyanobacterium TDX16]